MTDNWNIPEKKLHLNLKKLNYYSSEDNGISLQNYSLFSLFIEKESSELV